MQSFYVLAHREKQVATLIEIRVVTLFVRFVKNKIIILILFRKVDRFQRQPKPLLILFCIFKPIVLVSSDNKQF